MERFEIHVHTDWTLINPTQRVRTKYQNFRKMLCNIALVFISYLVRIFMRIIFISTVHKYLKQRLRQSGCRHTKTSLDQYDINNIVIVLFNTNYNNYTYWHLYFHYYVIYFTTLYAELSRSCYQREEFRVFNCPERESNPHLQLFSLKIIFLD